MNANVRYRCPDLKHILHHVNVVYGGSARLIGSRVLGFTHDGSDWDVIARLPRVADANFYAALLADELEACPFRVVRDEFAGLPGVCVALGDVRVEILGLDAESYLLTSEAYDFAIEYEKLLTIEERSDLWDLKRQDKAAFYQALGIPFPAFGRNVAAPRVHTNHGG